MKSLIIHPEDPTTNFLKPIYAPIPNKTVIKGGINKTELKKLIDKHDRVLMLGHGSPDGLFSSNQFLIDEPYIVDDSFSKLLSRKKDNIFIWCNANQFVERNGLSGFFTGMFISEPEEAIFYDFWDLEPSAIEKSNDCFSTSVSKYINEGGVSPGIKASLKDIIEHTRPYSIVLKI